MPPSSLQNQSTFSVPRPALESDSRRGFLATAAAGSVLSVLGWQIGSGTAAPDEQAEALHPFHDNVKVRVTDDLLIVESNGLPTHRTAKFPNRYNPNRIQRQQYRFEIPRYPKIARQITKLPMGPIGLAVNGIPFYNPYTREGNDAVAGPFREVFDSCCGHPDPLGRYHYHKYPVCVKSPFRDPENGHSPVIGLAFDGFTVYGPNDAGGRPPEDLDECNGHTDDKRGYHYHVTDSFPYILGGYRGEVRLANRDRRGDFRGQRGPQRGQGRGPRGSGRPPFGPPPGGGPPPQGGRPSGNGRPPGPPAGGESASRQIRS